MVKYRVRITFRFRFCKFDEPSYGKAPLLKHASTRWISMFEKGLDFHFMTRKPFRVLLL